MDDRDFPHVSLDFPRTDPVIEPAARAMHRNPAGAFLSGAPHWIGEPYLEKVGYAHIPMLGIAVHCRPEDLSGLLPLIRQRAFAWLAERAVSDEHLRFTPSVGRGGRLRAFTDQDGKRRFGEHNEVHFDLSHMLSEAVSWQGNRGTLVPTWQLATAAPGENVR